MNRKCFAPVVELNALIREIADAAMCVHTTLRPGFLESVYSRALLSELLHRQVVAEKPE